MQGASELKAFYEKELLPDLAVLEGKRRQTAITCAIFIPSGLLGLFLSIAYLQGAAQIIGALGSAVLIGLSRFYIFKSIARDFKVKVIGKLILFFNPSLQYWGERFIPQQQYWESGIFRQPPDSYDGEDLVSGSLGSTRFDFSEIHSQYKTEYRDSDGRHRTQWQTIFKGIFFIADFNKHFSGKVYVLPDTAERVFGSLGQSLQSMNQAWGNLVRLEDPEFEKLFVVYGSDQVEARYILSTSLLARIVQLRRKFQCPVYLSFVGSKLYLAIAMERDIFEPKYFHTLLDMNAIQQYYDDLKLVTEIMEDLNLNTRIWSKAS